MIGGRSRAATWAARVKRAVLALALLAGVALAGAAAGAASESDTATTASASPDVEALVDQMGPLSAEERAALLAKVTDSQARELLLHYLALNAPAAPEESAAGSVSAITKAKEMAVQVGESLHQIGAAAPNVVEAYGRLMEEHLQVTFGAGGGLLILGTLLLLCAVGAVAEWIVRRGLEPVLRANREAPCETARGQFLRTFTWLIAELAAILAFAGGYVAAFFAAWHGNPARRDFVLAVLVAILITRVAVALTRFAFAPKSPAWRLMPVDDEAAAHFVRGARRLAVLGSVLLLASMFGHAWGLAHDEWRFIALVSGLVFAAAALNFIVRYQRHARRAVEAALGSEAVPRWAGGAAGWLWHLLAVMYVLAAFLLGSVSLLVDRSFDPVAAVLGFLILFVLYPYLNTLLGRMIAPLRTGEDAAPPTPTYDQQFMAEVGESEDEGAINAAISAAALRAADRRTLQADRRVLRRIVAIATFVACLFLFAVVVGIDLFGDTSAHPVASFLIRILVDVGLVGLVAYGFWSFASAWIDRKLAEEYAKVPLGSGDPTEGPAMQGGTRLQTTLPLVRKTLAITVLVLALLVSLDALGVNIVPLIAGAGVIGLAIGFGSQTLVKDIISGLFFLMDDAFRIGEFIESGSISGTVERFNLRSLALRGYLGAVYTVPYGAIGSVTNYSRDWVIMKLRFRVPYDTDLDLVRKIFKKIGQEMMEDPELGPNFLQPFKSQGVVKMDDSAFVVSGKFMTQPNKQWGVRKAVYEKVQQAFKENGIAFAPKRVIVEVPAEHHFEEDDELPRKRALTAGAAAAVATEGD